MARPKKVQAQFGNAHQCAKSMALPASNGKQHPDQENNVQRMSRSVMQPTNDPKSAWSVHPR